MSEIKIVAASIVNFLKQQLEGETLSVDSRESVEVGVQCIETAFELTPDELARGVDLLQLVRQQKGAPAPAERDEAERLKNEGNELMKADRYREALAKYSRAIELDPRNSVYFCNRAAAHFKMGAHESAVADCTAALALQPNYGKAHGRLGIALTALDRHAEARAAFARASQLEPDNESYKQNLRLADERLSSRGGERRLDLGGLLQNPALLNMATEMLSDPNMQNLISGLMTTATPPAGNGAAPAAGNAGGMNALLEAGQALAQHMQSANPDLVEQLRRQMRPPGPGGNPPPQ
ncbi:small glutamine-rich tetratricopeptide repeat-containing protein alpha-like [Maniola hyperantus]|uniref:small glutamine-rich tetratricopeptide repeat-containing protein alpha-like n=1 Tax=Aphantopus hyperantus TaxID=2795564 RepID=UPI001567EE8B|nr:small glutamine-rich tetratricopeptide repeat-containing protein alpha-like [Maniola hyperantus]